MASSCSIPTPAIRERDPGGLSATLAVLCHLGRADCCHRDLVVSPGSRRGRAARAGSDRPSTPMRMRNIRMIADARARSVRGNRQDHGCGWRNAGGAVQFKMVPSSPWTWGLIWQKAGLAKQPDHRTASAVETHAATEGFADCCDAKSNACCDDLLLEAKCVARDGMRLKAQLLGKFRCDGNALLLRRGALLHEPCLWPSQGGPPG